MITTGSSSSSAHIMVVDDARRIVASVPRALIYEGYSAEVASDGPSALASARSTAVHYASKTRDDDGRILDPNAPATPRLRGAMIHICTVDWAGCPFGNLTEQTAKPIIVRLHRGGDHRKRVVRRQSSER
jgi:CheY-like chemotaxis protein